jgi:hypothetical protein
MAATKDALFSQVDTTGGGSNFVWTGRDVAAGGRWVYAVFMGDGAAARVISSLTSPNLSWSRHRSAINSVNEIVVDIWKAWASGALTGEVITQTDGSGASFNRRYFLFLTVQGSDEATGIGASAASSTTASGGDPSISVTPEAADSYLFAGLCYREGGSGDQAPTGGATSEYDSGGVGFAFAAQAASKASTGTGSHSIAFAGDDVTGNWQMAIVEIKAAAPVGGGALPFSSRLDYQRVA